MITTFLRDALSLCLNVCLLVCLLCLCAPLVSFVCLSGGAGAFFCLNLAVAKAVPWAVKWCPARSSYTPARHVPLSLSLVIALPFHDSLALLSFPSFHSSVHLSVYAGLSVYMCDSQLCACEERKKKKENETTTTTKFCLHGSLARGRGACFFSCCLLLDSAPPPLPSLLYSCSLSRLCAHALFIGALQGRLALFRCVSCLASPFLLFFFFFLLPLFSLSLVSLY